MKKLIAASLLFLPSCFVHPGVGVRSLPTVEDMRGEVEAVNPTHECTMLADAPIHSKFRIYVDAESFGLTNLTSVDTFTEAELHRVYCIPPVDLDAVLTDSDGMYVDEGCLGKRVAWQDTIVINGKSVGIEVGCLQK